MVGCPKVSGGLVGVLKLKETQLNENFRSSTDRSVSRCGNTLQISQKARSRALAMPLKE